MFRTCLVTHLLFTLILLNLGSLNVHLGLVVGCHEAEREALFKFKQSFHDPTNGLSSWKGKDCCRWEGVGCDNITAFVNRLDLHNPYSDPYLFNCEALPFLIARELDPSLLELRQLSYLDLSCNDFNGSQIPGFIGLFKHLRHLNLSYSNFSGVVPPQLGNLTRLQTLDLASPPLSIFGNWFLSSDLQWASTLVSLQYLNMGGNLISHTKNSMHMLNMPPLLGLQLQFCFFDTTVFSYLFSNSTWLSTIQQLDLSYNNLEGPLPHVFPNMTSLRVLQLTMNTFNGSVPLWLTNMKKLVHLDISSNYFSSVEGGTVMGILGSLCKLRTFSLTYNSIGGEIGVHRNVSKCIPYNLEILELRGNMIGGALPHWLGDFKRLRILDISQNKLSGNIPEDLGQCKALVSIDLSSNFLQGAVSESHLGNLSRLESLDLSFNPLVLNFTSTWSPPFQLSKLRMRSCKIQTQFPRWIMEQTGLIVLDISDNNMPGKLVQGFPSLKLKEINISHNQITGPVPYFSSSQLSSIDLSYNMLSGSLLHADPSAKSDTVGKPVCELPSLGFLDLQSNKIVGTIPDCWG